MINSLNLELLAPQKIYHIRASTLLILNLIVGLIIFLIMGAQHTSIGFHADDYGITYNGNISTLSDIKRIFYHGDLIIAANQPLDEPCTPRLSFLEVIYRPLLLVSMGLQRKICGLNSYYFHLIHTSLHVIISLVIFNFIALYTHPIAGIITSLFFGLHTSLKDYFFWQCYIQNSLQTVFLLMFIFCICAWLYSRKKLWLLVSFAIFLLALFLRETLLFFPLIPLAGLIIFKKSQIAIPELCKNFFKMGSFFGISILSYLMLRLWAYPFSSEAKSLGIKSMTSSSTSFIETFRGKFFDLLTCGFDMLGIKWLPSNEGLWLLKLSILIGITGISLWLWRKNPYKKIIMLLLISTIVLSWPAWLLVHCSRYIYPAVLSLSLMIGLLVKPLFISYSNKLGQYLFAIGGFCFVTLQGYMTNISLTRWVKSSNIEQHTIQSLASYMRENQNIVIENYPAEYLSVGYRAGLKLYGVKNTQAQKDSTKPSLTLRWDPTSGVFEKIDTPS
jgi:hypothetical protein